MEKAAIPLLILLLLITPFAPFNYANGMGEPSDVQTLVVRIPLSECEILEKDGVAEVKMDGFGSLMEPGYPILPSKVELIAIPPNAHVKNISYTSRIVVKEGICVRRAPPIITLNGEIVKEASSPSQGIYPKRVVRLIEETFFRAYKVAMVRVCPVQYDLARKKLIIHEDLQVVVKYEVDSGLKLNRRPRWTVFDALAKELIVNWKEAVARGWRAIPMGSGKLRPGTYDYLIICPSSLYEAYQNLSEVKESFGVKTVIKTIEEIAAQYSGVDLAEEIRNFIVDAYRTWQVVWVLLGADVDTLPARYIYSSEYYERGYRVSGYLKPTDYYYACLDGSWDVDEDGLYGEAPQDCTYGVDEVDWLPEVIVGRWPVDYPEQVDALSKALFNYSLMKKPKTALFCGAVWGYTWDWGNSTDGAYIKYIIDHLDDFSDWDKRRRYETTGHYDREEGWQVDQPANLTEEDVIWELSTFNFTFVNCASHGSPDALWRYTPEAYYPYLREQDAELVTNDYLPVYFAAACSTGAYDEDEVGEGYPCIAEYFVTERKALGFVGCSRVAYGYAGNDYNWRGLAGGMDVLYAMGLVNTSRPGDALMWMKVHYVLGGEYSTWNETSYYERKLVLCYNLMGDPEEIAGRKRSGYNLTIRVVDLNGNPVEGASIRILHDFLPEKILLSNASGEASCKIAGEVRVYAWKDDYGGFKELFVDNNTKVTVRLEVRVNVSSCEPYYYWEDIAKFRVRVLNLTSGLGVGPFQFSWTVSGSGIIGGGCGVCNASGVGEARFFVKPGLEEGYYKFNVTLLYLEISGGVLFEVKAGAYIVISPTSIKARIGDKVERDVTLANKGTATASSVNITIQEQGDVELLSVRSIRLNQFRPSESYVYHMKAVSGKRHWALEFNITYFVGKDLRNRRRTLTCTVFVEVYSLMIIVKTPSGIPIPNAEVEITGAWETIKTDREGIAETELPKGDYGLTIRYLGKVVYSGWIGRLEAPKHMEITCAVHRLKVSAPGRSIRVSGEGLLVKGRDQVDVLLPEGKYHVSCSGIPPSEHDVLLVEDVEIRVGGVPWYPLLAVPTAFAVTALVGRKRRKRSD